MASDNTGIEKRSRAAILSFFIVGAGQVFSGRFWTGLWFFIIFYGTILILKIVWTGINQGFWGILTAWALVWLYNIFDAYKGANYNKAPCEKECPAGIAPWTYLNQIGSQAQWRYPFVPFFKILELICPAPCEDKCTRRVVDDAVAIRYLKCNVALETPVKPGAAKRKEKIAIVGAGPCGLTAAYFLSHTGYEVTVYEKNKKAGGIPRLLIPEFRLPSVTAENEIKKFLNDNIRMHCGIEVGKDRSFDSLLNEHDIIFIATGAWKQTKLMIAGEEKILDAFSLLKRIRDGEKLQLGTIGVIGGGNTAIDIARCLRRMGSKVSIYYRRRLEDMPCEHEDKMEAIEEGIEIIPLTMLVSYAQGSIVMVKTECRAGRRGSVEVVKGSDFSVKLDNIVCALGQQPDTGFLKNAIKTDGSGRIIINRNGYRTNHPKVYAGGDAVLGPQTVAHAVGHGMAAARQIDQDIRRVPGLVRWLMKNEGLPAAVKILKLNNGPRMTVPHREISKRLKDFRQVEQVADKELMAQEANRCLTCPLRYRP
jgi:NADPH-dependent glutamate synthase beta subunit-like oxidoreductase